MSWDSLKKPDSDSSEQPDFMRTGMFRATEIGPRLANVIEWILGECKRPGSVGITMESRLHPEKSTQEK